MPVTIKCLNCGKEFEVPPYVIRIGKGKFCSKKCYSEYLRKSGARKGKNNPSWKGGMVKKICLNCGKEFEVIPARAESAKFCSTKCVGEWNSKHRIGENHPNYIGKIKKICFVCGKEFYVYPYQAETAKFCSVDCRKKRVIKKCLNCGKEFEVQYYEKDRKVFCSLTCKRDYYANHFELDQNVINYIDGLLLGDGCITSINTSASYYQAFAIRYIEWAEKVKQDFEQFGIKSFIKVYKPKNSYTQNKMVRLRTLNYKEFITFRERWYVNGKKIPHDLKLTPITVLNWYLGDGSLIKKTYTISIATDGFSIKEAHILCDLLKNEIGISPKVVLNKNRPEIRFWRKQQVIDFLEYIGKPPVKCFEYKWL